MSMTPDQIQSSLETLKDLTNDAGKQMIATLQAELKVLLSVKEPEKVIVEKEKRVEVVKPLTGDRRADERDVSEHDQHVAENLHYTPKAK